MNDDSFNPVVPESTDAELISFSLNHLLLSELGKTKFSIDQRNAIIYNHDSLPFLTKLPNRVVVTYTNGRGDDGNLQTVPEEGEEPVWIQSEDSVYIVNTVVIYNPVWNDETNKLETDTVFITKFAEFNVVAKDLTTKKYSLKINIHQVDPDSIRYEPIASDLSFLDSEENKTVKFNNSYFTYVKDAEGVSTYQSTDMITWEKINIAYYAMGIPPILPKNTIVKEIKSSEQGVFALTETGELYTTVNGYHWQFVNVEYPVKSILGYMHTNALQQEGLALIVEKEGNLVFAFMSEFSTALVKYGTVVPANFPISDFLVVNNQSNVVNRITVVNGISSSDEDLNTVWTTEDGLKWVFLTKKQGSLPLIKGGNAFIYNGRIYFAGGVVVGETENPFNERVYTSRDGGMTWQQEAAKAEFPESFERRMNASSVVDNEGIYFYMIGGTDNAGSARRDVWKGVVNSRTFQK